MKGNVRINCVNCSTLFTTEVDFPEENKGFTETIAQCPYCGYKLKIWDEHEYNEDGTIKG